jgi:hypothetical protein
MVVAMVRTTEEIRDYPEIRAGPKKATHRASLKGFTLLVTANASASLLTTG